MPPREVRGTQLKSSSPQINLYGKIYDTIYCGKQFFELA
jgi:hypothetical protein